MRIVFTLAALAGAGVLPVFAQEGTKPAPVLEIIREATKEGRTAAHEKVEADYAAAFRKASFPAYYIGLQAMSGPGEMWFIQPMPSFAAAEEYDKAMDKEPLKSTLALMDARDGELRAASQSTWAVYHPELSYRPEKFNRATQRFVLVTTAHVKPGEGEDYTNGLKTLHDGYDKANVDRCILAYQVVAGAPAGTYLLFTVMESIKTMDGQAAFIQSVQDAMGRENYSRLMKSAGDVFASSENTLLEVRPGMSYVGKETIDAAPAFWKPKPAAAAKPASAEKKTAAP